METVCPDCESRQCHPPVDVDELCNRLAAQLRVRPQSVEADVLSGVGHAALHQSLQQAVLAAGSDTGRGPGHKHAHRRPEMTR